MSSKINKLLAFLKAVIQEPSLANIILNNNDVTKKKFLEKYPGFLSLPQVEIADLGKFPDLPIESFLLDGSSTVTDLLLLSTLASRENINSYLEIGTWRGESVHNVAKYVEDCTTINLSEKEMKDLGWSAKYAEQHGILSKKNSAIKHLFGNTKLFDFAALKKKYDFIFIDGDHSYEMVLSDTKKVFEHLVHKDTIVVWHDYAYNPQKVRYEVFQAILDGTGKENHPFLFHPKNTMCAVFIKEKLPTSVFDDMEFPNKIFEIDLKQKAF